MNGTYTAYPQKLQSLSDEILEKLDTTSIIDAVSNSTKAILAQLEKKDGVIEKLVRGMEVVCDKLDQITAVLEGQNQDGQPAFSMNRDFYEPDLTESEPQPENDWQL